MKSISELSMDREAIERRLLRRVRKRAADCWDWMGTRHPHGHGIVNYEKKPWYVHRVAYELWVGPLVDGFVVHHRCRNRACIRPDHLEALPLAVHAGLAVGNVYIPALYRAPVITVEQRLLASRVVTESGCWEWPRKKGTRYATTTDKGQSWGVHRLAYTLWVGAIPPGLEIDHLCRNTHCFNPAHLEAVDHFEHRRRTFERAKVPFLPRGDEHWNAVLDEEKVRQIRVLRKSGIGPREVGARFGVSRQSVADIVSGRTWSWLK